MVDLPEGVYRVMASTHLKNTEVKICVFHQYAKKGESKQRFYTSSHVTDEKGLLPILPFTYLKPEVWELFCNFSDDGPPQETLTISIKEITAQIKPQLQIILNQEHFILEKDENSILISGVIKNRQNFGELTEPFEGKLYSQLRNSHNGEVLLSNQEPVLQQLPYSFNQVINNINWSMELILGELILLDQNLDIVTRESFTITINLEQLLHRGKYKRYNNQIELLQWNKSVHNYEQFPHSDGQVLPPKIPTNPGSYRTKVIDLPRFSRSQNNNSAPCLPQNNGHQTTDNSSSLVTKPHHGSGLSLPQIKPRSVKVDQEFASLNLESRFFSRLYNLAVLPQNNHDKSEEKPSFDEQEIPVFRGNISDFITQQQLDFLSVPSPILNVFSEEIKAGNPLNINLKIPKYTNNISVKLWLQDRQTRSLLIEPIYVHGFILNDQNELETTTELTIPFGSLELVVEAIAIDHKTKRESYKTSLILPVSPV